MTYQPHFINLSGTVIITMPFPKGPVDSLLPSWQRLQNLKITADLKESDDGTYFLLELVSYDDSRKSPWNAKVLVVLQHLWDELIKCELVEGRMPSVIDGNPLDMVHT